MEFDFFLLGAASPFWFSGGGGAGFFSIDEKISLCYDIKPVRKEEEKFYWKIP